MIRAVALQNLIYDGRVIEKGVAFDCGETPFFVFEKRGVVSRVNIISGENTVEGEELLPIDDLPTLADEQKTKGKKK